MTLVERLRGWCIDWNGVDMGVGERPRDGLHCDILREAADRIETLERAQMTLVERLRAELGWGIGPAMLVQEAAARIEALEEWERKRSLDLMQLGNDYQRLREALREIAAFHGPIPDIARAALEEDGDG